jgi:hypothetical protein
MRPRFTIADDAWKRACQYAADTHRTPSELVVEALEQLQARYPKRHRTIAEAEFDALCEKVALRLSTVPAGTSGGNL